MAPCSVVPSEVILDKKKKKRKVQFSLEGEFKDKPELRLKG